MKKLPSTGRFTFSTLQLQVAEILQFHFPESPEQQGLWLAKLIENKKKVGRQVRKSEVIPIDLLVESFLMIVGFATFCRIDVQRVVTLGYPGFCVYCNKKTCECTAPGVPRPLLRVKAIPEPNLKITFGVFQKRDFKVYPNDKGREAKLLRAMHLSEEFDEWTIEFLRNSSVEKLEEEIGDVLERMISFASTFDINLGREIALFIDRLALS